MVHFRPFLALIALIALAGCSNSGTDQKPTVKKQISPVDPNKPSINDNSENTYFSLKQGCSLVLNPKPELIKPQKNWSVVCSDQLLEFDLNGKLKRTFKFPEDTKKIAIYTLSGIFIFQFDSDGAVKHSFLNSQWNLEDLTGYSSSNPSSEAIQMIQDHLIIKNYRGATAYDLSGPVPRLTGRLQSDGYLSGYTNSFCETIEVGLCLWDRNNHLHLLDWNLNEIKELSWPEGVTIEFNALSKDLWYSVETKNGLGPKDQEIHIFEGHQPLPTKLSLPQTGKLKLFQLKDNYVVYDSFFNSVGYLYFFNSKGELLKKHEIKNISNLFKIVPIGEKIFVQYASELTLYSALNEPELLPFKSYADFQEHHLTDGSTILYVPDYYGPWILKFNAKGQLVVNQKYKGIRTGNSTALLANDSFIIDASENNKSILFEITKNNTVNKIPWNGYSWEEMKQTPTGNYLFNSTHHLTLTDSRLNIIAETSGAFFIKGFKFDAIDDTHWIGQSTQWSSGVNFTLLNLKYPQTLTMGYNGLIPFNENSFFAKTNDGSLSLLNEEGEVISTLKNQDLMPKKYSDHFYSILTKYVGYERIQTVQMINESGDVRAKTDESLQLSPIRLGPFEDSNGNFYIFSNHSSEDKRLLMFSKNGQLLKDVILPNVKFTFEGENEVFQFQDSTITFFTNDWNNYEKKIKIEILNPDLSTRKIEKLSNDPSFYKKANVWVWTDRTEETWKLRLRTADQDGNTYQVDTPCSYNISPFEWGDRIGVFCDSHLYVYNSKLKLSQKHLFLETRDQLLPVNFVSKWGPVTAALEDTENSQKSVKFFTEDLKTKIVIFWPNYYGNPGFSFSNRLTANRIEIPGCGFFNFKNGKFENHFQYNHESPIEIQNSFFYGTKDGLIKVTPKNTFKSDITADNCRVEVETAQ